MIRIAVLVTAALAICTSSNAAATTTSPVLNFELKHGAQGTGNYKGKKDRHEKPGPQNEKKKKSDSWLPLKK